MNYHTLDSEHIALAQGLQHKNTRETVLYQGLC